MHLYPNDFFNCLSRITNQLEARKNILIISPHFPPSNLASVHRSRIFAKHLPAFGWSPIILTIHEKFYEEELDHNLEQLIPPSLRIEKVKAFPLSKPRIFGDTGLRGILYLYRTAKRIIKKEKIDFLYIPIPSFYPALLGRLLHRSTGIPYGIDYIDPWVHRFPGSDKFFSKHWLSTKIAKILEPIAVRKASLITGVAEGYYKGVQERNPLLENRCIFGAMPYGGEKDDHERVKEIDIKPFLFKKEPGIIKLVYAGAMLPKAYEPLDRIFTSLRSRLDDFRNVQFHFIGTGKTPNDPNGYNVKALAEKYGLWGTSVFEYPKRIPYLDVLIHLNAADGVFILGSTEPHYTPSKLYQAVLALKPILAVLNEKSSAVAILKQSDAGMVLDFNGEEGLNHIEKSFSNFLEQFIKWTENFNPSQIKLEIFNEYSASAVTKKLADLLDSALDNGIKYNNKR